MNSSELTIDVLKELTELEIHIHWPALGTSKQDIENLLDENFWEVGASGKKYDREIVLKVLLERAQKKNREIWASENFQCTLLAENIYLLTYTNYQGERKAERSSIWKKFDSGYKLIYHQGTIVSCT